MKLKFKQQRNGRREGASTEGYTSLAKAKANYAKVTTKAPAVEDAEVVKHKNVVK